MAQAVTPEVKVVEAQHFVAGLANERAATNADVQAMQKLKAEKGSKAVFEEPLEIPKDDRKEPNFDELEKTIGEMSVATPTAVARKAEVTNRVNYMKNILDKTIPPPAPLAGEMQFIGRIMSDVPGFVASIAKDSGLSPLVVKGILRVAAGNVIDYIRDLRNSGKFQEILSNNTGAIEVTDDMIKARENIKALEDKTTNDQTVLDNEKKLYDNAGIPQGVKQWFEVTLAPPQQVTLRNNATNFDNARAALKNTVLPQDLQKPGGLNPADVAGYQGLVDGEIAVLFPPALPAPFNALGNYAAINGAGGIEMVLTAMRMSVDPTVRTQGAFIQNKVRALIKAYDGATTLNAILGADPNFENGDYKKYKMYDDIPRKKTEWDTKQQAINTEKAQLPQSKSIHNKDVTKLAGKMEIGLEKSIKEFYNNELLKRAGEIAELDAKQKTEKKQQEADLKEKQLTNAKTMLSNYLRMSFLRYAGNKVNFDDAGVRQLVKKDLYSYSPAEMGRQLLLRIYNNRAGYPGTYAAEIDAMAKEMGVTAGPPPVTFQNALDNIDTKELATLAAENMTKAFGYARARQFWEDDIKMSRAQAEFLRSAYGAEYFTKLIDSDQEFKKQFDAEFNTGMLNHEELKHNIDQLLFGKNWRSFLKRVLGIGAGVGAMALNPGIASAVASVAVAGAEVGQLAGRVIPRVVEQAGTAIATTAARIP